MPPKGLWANFNVTMDRINSLPYEHQVAFAKKTLLWVTTAVRPLKVDELRHAMRIAEAPLDFKLSTIPAAQLVVEYCFGFVTIDPKSDTVRLAHFSIDEYLRQKQFSFITSGHTTVSLACVNYMLLPWLPRSLQNLREDDDLDGISEQDSEILKVSSDNNNNNNNNNNNTAPSSQALSGPSFHDGGSTSAESTLETIIGLLKPVSGTTGPDGFRDRQSEVPADNGDTGPSLLSSRPDRRRSYAEINAEFNALVLQMVSLHLQLGLARHGTRDMGVNGPMVQKSEISTAMSDKDDVEILPFSLSNLLNDQENMAGAAALEAVFKKLPFMDYATSYWGYHAAKEFSGVVADTVNRWVLNDESFGFWSWVNERGA